MKGPGGRGSTRRRKFKSRYALARENKKRKILTSFTVLSNAGHVQSGHAVIPFARFQRKIRPLPFSQNGKTTSEKNPFSAQAPPGGPDSIEI